MLATKNRVAISKFIAERIEDIFNTNKLQIKVFDKSSQPVYIVDQPLEFYVAMYDYLKTNSKLVLAAAVSINGRLAGTIEFVQMMSVLRFFKADAYIPNYSQLMEGDITKEFLIDVYGTRTANGTCYGKHCTLGYVDSLQNYPCLD